MPRKLIKQQYFASKELRISVALIILWSLLITAFFTYFAKELGGKIGHGIPLFTIVMLGYILIVVVLTMLFSHRLIGPFQRLKTEMRLIISGDYHKRLNVRSNDDIYIRSFVTEVNRLLDELDMIQQRKEDLMKRIDSELLGMISAIEESELSKEKLIETVLLFHKRLKSTAQEKNERDTIEIT